MKFLKWMMVAFMAMWLAACGGGGGSGGSSLFGGGSSTTTAGSLTVKLSLSSTVASASTPVIVTATVTDAAGGVVSGASVAFSLGTSNLVSLSANTAITDASGVAKVTLSAMSGTAVGTDVVSAVATSGGVTSAKATASVSANSAASIEMLSSANTASSAGDEVTITAIVKAEGGVGLSDAPVVFTTDTGTLKSPSAKTDASGVATVKFTAGANKSNRTANIKVVSGSSTSSYPLPIEGTKLSVSGASTVALNGSTTLTIKAADATGNAIPNADVALTSSLSNTLSAVSLKTDAQGQATVTYTARSAGNDTLSFKGLGTTASASIVVSSIDFAFLSPAASAQVPVGTSQVLQVRYRQSSVGVPNAVVNFATTGGTLSALTATTDVNGLAQVSIQSTSAAPATVQATLSSGGALATLPLSFVATVPSSLVLQASPTAIGPNVAGAQTNQAQVLAKVTDSAGNPVPSVTVNFSRDLDPSAGNLLQSSAVTDVNGLATVQYVSGPQSTTNNGVTLRGTVASATSVTGTTGLTVNQSALFIALGTGNVISNVDDQTYKRNWTAYVTDSSGVAVPNVTLSVSLLPQRYRKGVMVWDADASLWQVVVAATCISEDLYYGESDVRSYNGQIDGLEDSTSNGNGNGNGKLEPGNVIALVAGGGTVKTDASGRATISYTYAESYAPWVEVRLRVRAIVNGTESSTSATFFVDGLSDDWAKQSVKPAGAVSPFGTMASCTNPA